MSLNGSGIRDIQRVLGLTLVTILFILRNWFKTLEEPVVEGHFKNVQIDEMWTFVKQRKAGKRWFWYAYDSDSGKILAFYIGKRNDSACKALMKKLSHLEIGAYRTDDWKSYKKHIPIEKHIISKAKTTNIERRNRDFRTHIKRLCRETVCFSKKGETVCFSKKDDMHYGLLKAYVFIRNKFGSLVKTEHTF